jgi:hypothetical protein
MTAKSAAMAMVTFVVMGITMILPTYSFAQTTEDDSYTYDSGDPEEPQEQDEQEQESWEDAGKPGDNDDDDDDDDGGSDSNPTPTLSSSVPTIETTTPLINVIAEEKAVDNACSAIGNGDAKKYTPLTFTKKMWADACPWLPGYDQSYVAGFLQGCMQKLDITDDTDNTCLKFVQDTMRKTFHSR